MGPSLHKTSISDSSVYSCRTKTILTSFRKKQNQKQRKAQNGNKRERHCQICDASSVDGQHQVFFNRVHRNYQI